MGLYVDNAGTRRYERQQYTRYAAHCARVNAAVTEHNAINPDDQLTPIRMQGYGEWLARRYDAALTNLAKRLEF